jgi:hypothetical protein
MFYRISMQICVHDVFVINILVLCVMILYHTMIPLSPLSSLIVASHQLFCQHGMHDTTFDTTIMASLIGKTMILNKNFKTSTIGTSTCSTMRTSVTVIGRGCPGLGLGRGQKT